MRRDGGLEISVCWEKEKQYRETDFKKSKAGGDRRAGLRRRKNRQGGKEFAQAEAENLERRKQNSQTHTQMKITTI